jgi:hypothetical protein
MPTIDALAPATAAADTDEYPTWQAGTTLKVTRAQVLAGVQPQLALQSGVLLGRSSGGTGAPEALTVGANLTLASGTLTASAAPYQVSALPAGTVPAPGDLIPLSQQGTNTAVPYSQFLSGLPEVANINASQMLLTATGSTTSVTLANFAAGTLPISGGSMTGPLTLSSVPTTSFQAAPKTYVDSQVATALPIAGGILSGPLTLVADPTTSLQAATKEYVDTRVFRSGDTLTGPLMLASNPVSALQAATKGYTDTQVATALPIAGGTLTGALSLAADPTLSSQAATKHYVDTQVATSLSLSGGTVTGPITLPANPTSAMQAAVKQYVDGQVATSLPLTGGTITGPISHAISPTTAMPIVVGVSLAAGATGSAYTVFGVNIPFSTSVFDTSNATQMTGAAAIRLAAGHQIAFEPTVTYRLAYDSSTGVLRWYQGSSLSYVVGKGITVGFETVCTGNTTLPNYYAGNIVFLAGVSTYTVTLPAAATLAAGTGFTFSVVSTATVSITPNGTDAIDNGPVTLHQNDRYHIISDGSSSWHEVFRANFVNPRFVGPPVLPSYTVAALPASAISGAQAYATNGRTATQAAGAGTGVEVFFNGVNWIAGCTGSPVLS